MKLSKTFQIIAVLLTLCGIGVGITPAQAQTPHLNINFTNNSTLADSNVWVSIQLQATNSPVTIELAHGGSVNWGTSLVTNTISVDGSNTYRTSTVNNILSDPLNLQTLKAHGGFNLTSVVGAVFYVSYSNALGSLINPPSPISSSDPSYNTAYQNFEITRTGNLGDQGDITAINWYSGNLNITSYDTNGNVVQNHVGFQQPSATTAAQLSALNTNAVQYNTNGVITRIVGPTAYPNYSIGTFPGLTNYLTSLQSNNTVINLNNQSSFKVNGDAGTNYSFNFVIPTTVSNGIITGTGNLIQIQTAGGSNNMTNSVGIQVTGTNAYAVTQALYSGNPGAITNFVFTGNWDQVLSNMVSIYGTTIGTANFNTIQAQAAGEISAAILSGLAGSTNTNSAWTGQLGSLQSSNWWALSNPPLFSAAQSDTNNYSQFGNIIYLASSNQVYGFPYSDRWQTASALVNAVQYNGTNVASWTIDVGTSIQGVPEPAPYTYALIGIGLIAFAAFRKRKA